MCMSLKNRVRLCIHLGTLCEIFNTCMIEIKKLYTSYVSVVRHTRSDYVNRLVFAGQVPWSLKGSGSHGCIPA